MVFAAASVPVMAVVVVASRFAFHLLYGPQFDAAVTPFILLAAANLLILVAGVFAWGLVAAGREATYVWITLPLPP